MLEWSPILRFVRRPEGLRCDSHIWSCIEIFSILLILDYHCLDLMLPQNCTTMDLHTPDHPEHAPQWCIPCPRRPHSCGRDDDDACLACLVELLEDDGMLAVKKQHVLAEFLHLLQYAKEPVMKLLCSDGRVTTHMVLVLLGTCFDIVVMEIDFFLSRFLNILKGTEIGMKKITEIIFFEFWLDQGLNLKFLTTWTGVVPNMLMSCLYCSSWSVVCLQVWHPAIQSQL